MDFTHLTQIARQAGIGNHETRYLRISMDSKRGQVLKYLRHIPQDTTLVDVQYGKTEGNTQYPVFGIAASDEDLDTIRTTLKKKGIEFEDISEDDERALPHDSLPGGAVPASPVRPHRISGTRRSLS